MSETEKRQRYYCSREWGLLREAVRQRCRGICERCNNAPMSHVHHLTYIHLYEERLEDLQGLCEPCHEFTHGKRERDPGDGIAYEPRKRSGRGCDPLNPREGDIDHFVDRAAVWLNQFEANGWTVAIAPDGDLRPRKLRPDALWDSRLAGLVFGMFAEWTRKIIEDRLAP